MRILLLFICLSTTTACFSQPRTDLSLDGYFTAIIVSEIEPSVIWYTQVLDFQMETSQVNDEMEFIQVNMKRANLALELIELGSALNPEESIPEYNQKSKLIGIFKFGFQVSDFDEWLVHLKAEEVEFHGDVVTDPLTGNRMLIIKDPDGNRIQIFEKTN